MKANIKKIGAASTAAALVAGSVVAMPMAQAFAEGGSQVTIGTADEAAYTFTAYKIFSGNVTGNKIAEPQFATGMEAAFKSAYNAYSGDKSAVSALWTTFDTSTNADQKAQAAVEIITKLMSDSADAPAADSFGFQLAKAVSAVSGAETVTLTGGQAGEVPVGYWLAVAKDAPAGNDVAKSGPIFFAADGTPVTATQKKSVPTLKKSIKDDATGSVFEEAGTADQTVGKSLDFKLVGSTPSNLDAYDTYVYNITDTPQNLNITADTIKVTVAGHVVYENGAAADGVTGLTVSTDGNVLKVNFTNLKAFADVAAGDADAVIVEYSAVVADSAISGVTKDNEAQLEYSNVPGQVGTGKTTPSKTTVKNHEFNITKTDMGTTDLTGALFTVTNDEDEQIVVDNAAANGSKATVTVTNNVVKIDGLDSGVYTIEETKAPSGYNKLMAPFQISVSEEGVVSIVEGSTGDTTLIPADRVIAAADNVTVKNSQGLELPITGQQGFMLITLAGGIVLAATLGGTIISKRRSSKDAE